MCERYVWSTHLCDHWQTHGNSRSKYGRVPGIHFAVRGIKTGVRGVQNEIDRLYGLLGGGADLHPALSEVCVEAEGRVCLSHLQRGGTQPSAELLWTHLLLPLPARTAVRTGATHLYRLTLKLDFNWISVSFAFQGELIAIQPSLPSWQDSHHTSRGQTCGSGFTWTIKI